MADYRPFDVVIVGAGPAGLALGTLLRPEQRVLVLERRASLARTPPLVSPCREQQLCCCSALT